jgi:hypothetical protein
MNKITKIGLAAVFGAVALGTAPLSAQPIRPCRTGWHIENLRDEFRGRSQIGILNELNLNRCRGLDVDRVYIEAASRFGRGTVRLEVNNRSTFQVFNTSRSLRSFTFSLGRGNDTLGDDIRQLRFVLNGNMYVSRIGAYLERRGRDDDGRRLVLLGDTGLTGTAGDRDVIPVGGNRRYESLVLLARDDAFHVQRMVIHFRNGGEQVEGGFTIRENSRTRVDLRGRDDRRIDRIEIFGRQAIPFGTRARLLIYGEVDDRGRDDFDDDRDGRGGSGPG